MKKENNTIKNDELGLDDFTIVEMDEPIFQPTQQVAAWRKKRYGYLSEDTKIGELQNNSREKIDMKE